MKEGLSEKRKEALRYMYDMSQVRWTPSEDIDLTSINKSLYFKTGEIYYGIIYTFYTAVNLEGFKSYLDENNVFHGPTELRQIPGNHCTSSIINAYKHIGDPITAHWSMDMHPARKTGLYPVGSYVYDDTDIVTEETIKHNTEEVMYESYASLQGGDCILSCWGKTGHARMVASVEVVRGEDGVIDPEKSHVKTLEQTWSMDKTAAVNTSWYINRTYSFKLLFDKFYIPLTVETLKKADK